MAGAVPSAPIRAIANGCSRGGARRIRVKGDTHIDGDKRFDGLHEATREQVIAAIYEAVIRPGRFGAFLEIWRDHISDALAAPVGPGGTGEEVEIDPELAAHFTRAHEILDRLGRSHPEVGLADRVARSGGFVMVVDGRGRIISAGGEARAALGGSDRVAALENMLAVQSGAVLKDLVAGLREGTFEQDARVLIREDNPRHLIVRVEPGEEPLLVIEALDYRWVPQAEQVLTDSFGLSRAEVGVVRGLMAGLSLREIAEQTGRSEHTVRNQAKSVLAKTGAPGQTDLIRLVAYLIKTEPDAPRRMAGRGALESQILDMKSGMRMEVLSVGPEDGYPLIFLHGMQDGVSPIEALHRRFHDRGYRVIAPIRPGFGQSDPVSDARRALPVFTSHVGEMMDRMDLRRPAILSHLGGAIAGHVLSGQLHGRIAGMVAVGGAVPITRRRDLNTMAAYQRSAAYTARYAPALLPMVLRLGMAQIDSRDFDELVHGIFPPGSHDHDVVRRLDLVGWIRSGYRFSVQQSYLGFLGDAHFAVRDWRPLIPQPAAPVILLHGTRDPVITPEMVRAFAEGRENVDLRFIEKAGQLIVYEHPGIMLDALDELTGRGARPAG